MPHYCPHCTREIAPGSLIRTRGPKRQPRCTKPPRKVNGRQKIWRSMTIARRFTVQELMATAEAREQNVRAYVTALLAVGYLRLVRVTTFEAGDHSIYQLIKNTGPHAPRLRTDGTVFDLNTQAVAEVAHG